MKRIIYLTLVTIALCTMLHSESIEVSGNLTGSNVWQADTVFVTGDLYLEKSAHLTIDSGTWVVFTDSFSFTAEGEIDANGSAQDSIRFVTNATPGVRSTWKGIDMIGATGDFLHCVFENVDGFEGAFHYMGGAILAREFCTVILDRCRFSGNVASCGGALSLSRSECQINNCTFTNNIAELEGGALYAENSSLEIIGSEFRANQSFEGSGFLINNCEGLVLIDDCLFQANIATRSGGGGLAIISTLLFEDCVFLDNVSGLNGGAFLAHMNDFEVVSCTFRNNQAVRGGAIDLFMGYYDFESCIFDQNSATYGGACNIREANYYPTIVNCLFTANTADFGGAFYGQDKNKPLLYNCTFAANEATSGSVFYSQRSTTSFVNCIMWGNPADNSYIYYQEHATTGDPSFYNGVIEGGTSSVGGPGIQPGSFIYTNMQENDPLFVLAGNYPYSVLTGSCAIDNGFPDASAIPTTTLDLAGNERIVNDIIDIGCYEFQGPDYQPTPPTPEDSGIVVTMGNPYRPGSSINLSIGNPGNVEVVIYNIKGQRVRSLFNDDVAGNINLPIVWNGTDECDRPVATGVYFCKMKYQGRTKTRKMLLMR